jgi:hypothetical protein
VKKASASLSLTVTLGSDEYRGRVNYLATNRTKVLNQTIDSITHHYSFSGLKSGYFFFQSYFHSVNNITYSQSYITLSA